MRVRDVFWPFSLGMLVIFFLFWLIYYRSAGAGVMVERVAAAGWTAFLPSLNAALNSVTAFLLVAGRVAIAKKKIQMHVRFMISAVVTSALFLASYILYHFYQGHTPFVAQGAFLRFCYFFILISHILLSIALVPLVLVTLTLAARENFPMHKRIARATFPIWLYVSFSGVAIFIFLAFFNR